MDGEYDPVPSHRLQSLAEKFRDKRYRDGYVAAHTRGVLADQMRNFRGDLSQADYAAKIEKQKTVVGRLENPAYSGWSLRTMLEVAHKEDVAVFVRFVDFVTFLRLTGDLSEQALRPEAYDEAVVDELAKEEERLLGESALKALFSAEPKQTTGQSVGNATQQQTARSRITFDPSRGVAPTPQAANDAIAGEQMPGASAVAVPA